MFLLPHHFQQSETFDAEQLALSSRFDHPYGYGFHALEIDEVAFENWQLAIRRASGRCKDGTIFDFSQGEIGRVDLSQQHNRLVHERLRNNESVTVYLAFPAIRPASKNVSIDQNESRFREFENELFDVREGDNYRPIVLKKLVPQVHFSQDRPEDFEYLPVCRLTLTDFRGKQIPKLDATFFPPATVTLAHPAAIKLFERFDDELTGYLRGLVEYFDLVGGASVASLANPEQSDSVCRYWLLSELRAWLVCHNQSTGLHPFVCFQQFCLTIGRLTMVDPQKEWLPQFKRYDHDDVYQSLEWAWGRIKRCFVATGETRIREIPLKAEKLDVGGSRDLVFKAAIPATLFEEDWNFYLGIYGGKLDKERAVTFFNSHLENHSKFYWKLASEQKIDLYFKQRALGMTFFNRAKSKPELPATKGWFFFDIKHDGYWDEVKQSCLLCLRIDQKNLKTPETDLGTRDITVYIEGTTYQFRISLFAVPGNLSSPPSH